MQPAVPEAAEAAADMPAHLLVQAAVAVPAEAAAETPAVSGAVLMSAEAAEEPGTAAIMEPAVQQEKLRYIMVVILRVKESHILILIPAMVR